eukprot:RCo018603
MADKVVQVKESMTKRSASLKTGKGSGPEQNEDEPKTDFGGFTVSFQCLTGRRLLMPVVPIETVMEIRQQLYESAECCYITSYRLVVEEHGKPSAEPTVLDDYVELRELPAVTPKCTIRMQFVNYDDKGIRQHVQRLMELIESPLSEILISTTALAAPVTVEKEGSRSYPCFNIPPSSGSKGSKEAKADSSTLGSAEYALAVTNDMVGFLERVAAMGIPLKRPDLAQDEKSPKKEKKSGKSNPEDNSAIFDLDGKTPLAYLRTLISAMSQNQRLPVPLHLLEYSGWNPPTCQRRLMGDLYYLRVITLSNVELHITASTGGFYVNKTTGTHFSPECQPLELDTFGAERSKASMTAPFETLLGLLCHYDSAFLKAMSYIVKVRSLLHPLESSPVPLPVAKTWLVDSLEADRPTHSMFRAQNMITQSYQTVDNKAPCREWNEEMQGCRDLPQNTVEEALLRDRILFRVHGDFVEAAVRGVVAAVNRQLAPINPMDPELHHVFMLNNIFYSCAVDGRGLYTAMGGDHAARVLAKQELQGLKLVSELLPLAGICVIDTIVVDYKGRRMVAQAILPGILQGEQECKHQYGAVENSEDIRWSPEFHDALCKLAEKLSLRVHKVQGADGAVHEMALPVDCKGIKGADNRLYLLEMVRLSPRDPNFPDRPTALLRPELIQQLRKKNRSKQALNAIAKSRAAMLRESKKVTPGEDSAGDASSSSSSSSSSSAPSAPQAEDGSSAASPGGADSLAASAPCSSCSSSGSPNDSTVPAGRSSAEATAEEKEKEETEDKEELLPLLNNDLLSRVKLADDEETLKRDEQAVRKLADFLTKDVLPQLVSDLTSLDYTVLDTLSLTRIFHERGVNMRYLGPVADLCPKESFARRLLVQEMLARICKRDLREIIDSTFRRAEAELPHAVSEYLNGLFGNHPDRSNGEAAGEPVGESPQKGKKKRRGGGGSGGNGGKEQACAYLESIPAKIQEAFQFLVGAVRDEKGDVVWWKSFSKISLLRALCLKVGLRVRSREYDFTATAPFAASDICDFYPLVSHVTPKSRTAQSAMEGGMLSMQLGQYDAAFSSLNEALDDYHQVCGPICKDMVSCYCHIGNLFYYGNEWEQALLYYHRALLTARRALGIDHPLIPNLHQHLGLICHAMGRHDVALSHFKRAHYLMKLLCGFDHPDACIALANMGTMCQELGDHLSAVKFLKEALQASEQVVGSSLPQFIPQLMACCYAMSISLSQLKDYKAAVTYQRRVYETQKTTCGPTAPTTLEAEKWLSTLLKLAVEAQKHHSGLPAAIAPRPAAAKLLWPNLRAIV